MDRLEETNRAMNQMHFGAKRRIKKHHNLSMSSGPGVSLMN